MRIMNDKKLQLYLDNVKHGIILIETNDNRESCRLCRWIHETYSISCVDYEDIKNGFVRCLQDSSGKDLCIYNFGEEAEQYDIVKSLNLSRELLRDMGRVVLIMPSFLSCQIQSKAPNLVDYLGLILNYNVFSLLPFDPEFAIYDDLYYTREELRTLKSQYKQDAQGNNISGYLNYVQQFRFKKLSAYEVQTNLLPSCYDLLTVIHEYIWENNKDMIRAQLDVLYHTGCVLACQCYFDEAQGLFREMQAVIKDSREWNVQRINAYEGLAYCHYYSGYYHEAMKDLLWCISYLDDLDTEHEAWKCRIYNDYAACYYKQGKYHDALANWKACERMMHDFHIDTAYRRLRNQYNQMLCHVQINEEWERHYAEWNEAFRDVFSSLSGDSVLGLKSEWLNLWIQGVCMGRVRESLSEGRLLLKKSHTLLRENDYILAVGNYVLGKLEFYSNHEKNGGAYLIKCHNILDNQVEMNQALFDVMRENVSV